MKNMREVSTLPTLMSRFPPFNSSHHNEASCYKTSGPFRQPLFGCNKLNAVMHNSVREVSTLPTLMSRFPPFNSSHHVQALGCEVSTPVRQRLLRHVVQNASVLNDQVLLSVLSLETAHTQKPRSSHRRSIDNGSRTGGEEGGSNSTHGMHSVHSSSSRNSETSSSGSRGSRNSSSSGGEGRGGGAKSAYSAGAAAWATGGKGGGVSGARGVSAGAAAWASGAARRPASVLVRQQAQGGSTGAGEILRWLLRKMCGAQFLVKWAVCYFSTFLDLAFSLPISLSLIVCVCVYVCVCLCVYVCLCVCVCMCVTYGDFESGLCSYG